MIDFKPNMVDFTLDLASVLFAWYLAAL